MIALMAVCLDEDDEIFPGEEGRRENREDPHQDKQSDQRSQAEREEPRNERRDNPEARQAAPATGNWQGFLAPSGRRSQAFVVPGG